jgi:hypothetical protein
MATWERLVGVDATIRFRHDPNELLSSPGQPSDPDFIVGAIQATSIDWNRVLRQLNLHYDELGIVARASSIADRDAKLAQVEEAINQRARSLSGPGRWVGAALSRANRSEMVADTMVVPSVFDAEDRANAQLDLLQLAAALAVYRAEHGQYPEKLEALVPSVLPAVPVDLFHGNPFVYQREGEGYLLYTRGANGTDDGGSSRLMGTYQGHPRDEGSEDERNQILSQIPANSDDYSIRLPRATIEPPRTPAEPEQ